MKKKILSILLCAVLLIALAACAGDKRPATDTDISFVPEPTQPPEVSVEPEKENPALTERDETMSLVLPGSEDNAETPLRLFGGIFADGPAFSLYGAEDCSFSAVEDQGFIMNLPGKQSCVLALRFEADLDAGNVAPGLLDRFEEIVSLEDEGTVSFAGYAARSVRGEGRLLSWHGIVIELPEGVVELVMCASPEAENDLAQIEALAKTIELVSMY